jgi:hypothetical protein
MHHIAEIRLCWERLFAKRRWHITIDEMTSLKNKLVRTTYPKYCKSMTHPSSWYVKSHTLIIVAPEPEGSSPYSQEPANGPYPEPGESTPNPPTNLPKITLMIVLHQNVHKFHLSSFSTHNRWHIHNSYFSLHISFNSKITSCHPQQFKLATCYSLLYQLHALPQLPQTEDAWKRSQQQVTFPLMAPSVPFNI